MRCSHVRFLLVTTVVIRALKTFRPDSDDDPKSMKKLCKSRSAVNIHMKPTNKIPFIAPKTISPPKRKFRNKTCGKCRPPFFSFLKPLPEKAKNTSNMGNAESSSSSDSEEDEKKRNKISTDEGVFCTKQKKEMVETCWVTAKNFGRRVYRRMFQKSSKFELVLIQIAETNAVALEEGGEEELAVADLAKWEPEARRLEQLLDAVVRNLHNSKVVMELCVQFGRGYAEWHRSGLKSQFWSDLGEAVVGEALCLEGAAAVQIKQKAVMIEAWTHLGGLVTDHCRTGYYAAMRDRRNRRDSGTVSSAYSTSTLFTEDSGSSV